MQPLIVGISGRKRSGKDTVASILGFSRVALADHLKYMAMQTWDLSFEQCYGSDEDKESVDPRWGLTPRRILQLLGTECGRNIHLETWTRRAFDTIARGARGEPIRYADLERRCFDEAYVVPPSGRSVWSVPDIRFADEGLAVRERGGVVVKVVRSCLDTTADLHASEVGADEVKEDILIRNDGDLEDLRVKVEAVKALLAVRA